MPLDPQAQMFCDAVNSLPKVEASDETLAAARANFGAMVVAGAGTPPEMASITDHDADGVPVRVYRPTDARDLPMVVYLHGGGWTIGTAKEFDPVAQHLAHVAEAVVVSVDYRLAPEYPFPAPLDDCWQALRYCAKQGDLFGGDPSRLAILGESAGGNLAAVCAIHARDAGGPQLALQVLVYPVTDCNFKTESMIDNADGYLLETERMRWFFDCYLRSGGDPADWRVSPLRARDLSGVAPALVLTAEYDPLRDEGEAYARRLQDAGVAVTKHRYDGAIHMFFAMPGLFDAGRDAMERVGTALRRAFGTLPA
jgi:acetyl esterase